jgi:hypothetical protein
MNQPARALTETVTLRQARSLIECLAHEQSVLLLSPPEDVSGIPRIVGERSVFCPPRILLPEDPRPFCLFLDELPACSPDIQKAFYSLLLERRLGEHPLPKGTWVVAAGNRAEDRALVRSLSSALVNRVIVLNVRVDSTEWLDWAKHSGIRAEIRAFILFQPGSLMRPVPDAPVPFSTPRAWASLSRALDLVEQRGALTRETRRALAFGRLTAEDAAIFCAMAEETIDRILPLEDYILCPEKLPESPTACWFILNRIRDLLDTGKLDGCGGEILNPFLRGLSEEHRMVLLVDRVPSWGRVGADESMLATLREVAGL